MKKKIRSERRQKKNLILPIFVISVLVLSGLGYLWTQEPEPEYQIVEYKGLIFKETNAGYQTEINNQQITITTNPLNLTNLPQTPNNLYLETLNSAEKIYLSINPEENLASPLRELSNLPLTPKIITAAYDNEISIAQDLPFKTCNEATPEKKVILIKDQEPTMISYEPNCLILQGKGLNLTKLTDKFVIDILTK